MAKDIYKKKIHVHGAYFVLFQYIETPVFWLFTLEPSVYDYVYDMKHDISTKISFIACLLEESCQFLGGGMGEGSKRKQ